MEFYEKTVKSQQVFEGKIIGVRVDTVLLPDGKQASREIVTHPGAVAVVPVNDQGEVFLVKQYRKPVEAVTIEIPAGKLDAGETSFACAVRELREETGLTAEKMEHLFDFFTTPGFSDERMHLFLATGLTIGTSEPDMDEVLELILLPLDEAIKRVLSGGFQDGKTIVGLLAAQKIIGR